ncbi:hypothetical protein ACFL17_06135 [Pseudomonadota bacterium]
MPFINAIWAMQTRLESFCGRQLRRLLEHPKSKAAYNFVYLRGETSEVDKKLCAWWTRIQSAITGE